MSLDGPGIIDSDDAHDIYNEFMGLYDEGMEIPAIIERSFATRNIGDWLDAIEEEIQMVALAQALWETGGVPEEIVSIIDRIIDSGRSWEEWKDEDEDLARQRRRILLRFRKKIRQPRSKPRRRISPMAVADQIYRLGECLTRQLSTGEAAAFIVLDVLRWRGTCSYFFGFMQMASDAGTSLESVRAGKIAGRSTTTSLLFPNETWPDTDDDFHSEIRATFESIRAGKTAGGSTTPPLRSPGKIWADTAVVSHSDMRAIRGSLVSAGSLELDDTQYIVGSSRPVQSWEELESAWLDHVVPESVWRNELIDLAPLLKR